MHASFLRDNRSRLIASIAAISLIAAAALVVAWWSDHATQDDVALALLALVALLLIAPVLFVAELRHDLLSPAVVTAGTYLLYLVISPANDLLTHDTVFLGRDFRDLYVSGLRLTVIAVVSFWIGYFVPLGRRIGGLLPTPSAPFEWGKTYSTMLMLAGIGGLVLWSFITRVPLSSFLLPGVFTQVTNGGGATEGGLNYLFYMIDLLIPAIILSFRCERSKRWTWFWLIVAGIIYASIGFRYRILIIGIALMTLLSLKRARAMPVRYILVGVSALVVLLIWVADNRAQIRAAGQGTISNVELTLTTGQELTDNLLGELRTFPTFLIVADAVPNRIDYDYGLTLAFVFIRPIPREIWPSKPAPPAQQIIVNSFGTNAALFSGPAYPNFGEYYIALGVPTLVLGMLAFGIGNRTLYEWLKTNIHNPWVQVAYAVSVGLLIQIIGRGYTAQNFNFWVFTVLPILLIGAFYRFMQRILRS
jgi:hypothetical protein